MTEWNDVLKSRKGIPTDTILVLELWVEDGEYSSTDYTIGFLSSKTGVFTEVPHNESLEEANDVIGYHVLYDRNGNTIRAYSSD